ncbi:protein transport protein bos1 [Malassezia brasiliensis]|uniref:Protein transport protein BOS1 n=1 Tax=Malassezia brasiliensis TaxID=1821822 RepID=A0AAF0DV15_9BASI|nr:protein transport protein bos1 [Malassezia brasiliensis]
MNSLYNLATRQTAAIRADVDAYSVDPAHTSARRAQINAAITTLLKTVEDYEGMAKRELVIAKREKALQRAADFRTEANQLRETLARADTSGGSPAHTSASARPMAPAMSAARPRTVDMMNHTAPPSMHPMASARPALQAYAQPTLSAHYTPPPTHASPYMYGGAAPPDPLAAYKMHQPIAPLSSESPYSVRENHALREHSFIQNTEAQLDAFIAQGRSVLGNLVEQRGILKGTRKRLLDAANTVGLSRELIGFIDRIGAQDRIIFAVGAVFTLFAFFMIYRWFG